MSFAGKCLILLAKFTFMIKAIIIQDFFSFRGENKIELNDGLNILLGINGSGKTTFLNAFRLLYEGVAGIGFEKLFQELWGGYMNVVNANHHDIPSQIKLTFIFDYKKLKIVTPKSPFKEDAFYEIIITPIGHTSYSIEERLYSENRKSPDKPFEYLKFKDGRGSFSVRHSTGVRIEHENYRGDVSSQELVLRQISDPRRYLPSHTIKMAISSMALYDTFNTESSSKIRKPAEYNSALRLNYNGENLVQLLSNLKTSDLWTYQEIEKQLLTVNQGFQSFEFSPFGSQLYMSIREVNMSHTIGMQHISDGTLRYTILMSILLNKQRGALIGLDEPEGRLHPDMINSIAEMLRRASLDSQLIIATHSPLLLNAFTLEDVLVFEKDENNATIVKRYYEEDFEKYDGEILPGQLWLRGEIGGKRW